MLFERVAESIEVLAAFREDRPEPVIFRWNNRHYQVRSVKTIHSEQTEIGKMFLFSVSDDRDIFHLSFRSDTMRWRLEERCALPVQA
ncbi:hypothetical protein KBB27_02385 [Patescibacteria group bacterium]|nr:hypothetical protein [Patescibacteria group bacterium]